MAQEHNNENITEIKKKMENKTFINMLAKRLNRDTKDVLALIEGLSVILRDKCGNMENVAIPGFGTFEPQKEDEHIITDNDTNKKILCPPQITLSFRSSVILRKRIID